MGSGQELPLLVGVPIDRVVDEVGADSTVVEQRVAFSRGSVACDGLALALGLDEELQELPFGLPDLLSE